MIRYSLRCDRDHGFDSWFRDSHAYEEQNRAGLVACPVCGSTEVGKSLMTPSVVTGRRKAAASTVAPAAAVESAPVALLDEKAQKLRSVMRELRDHVLKATQDVGAAFPDQARKMHEGEIAHRPIRGEASAVEVRALIEDGVEIMPVPQLPDDRN